MGSTTHVGKPDARPTSKALVVEAGTYEGASGSDVRESALAAGLAVGQRGRLSDQAIAAFNKGKRANRRYVPPMERMVRR